MKSAFPALATAMIPLAFLLALSGSARAATDVPDPAMPEKSALVLALEKAVDGLEMPSETDAPFKVVFFALDAEKTGAVCVAPATPDPATPAPTNPISQWLSHLHLAAPPADKAVTGETLPLTPAEIAKLVGAPADAKLETRDLDEFFKDATATQGWMNADEKATAARFAALLQLLKNELKGAQVVLWGESEKTVAIIGGCDGGAAGVTTLIVET